MITETTGYVALRGLLGCPESPDEEKARLRHCGREPERISLGISFVPMMVPDVSAFFPPWKPIDEVGSELRGDSCQLLPTDCDSEVPWVIICAASDRPCVLVSAA